MTIKAQVPPREAQIVNSISRRLKREPGVWQLKVHGDEMQRAGVPDIIGCMYGRLFALEVKRPGLGRVSKIQEYEMQQMANAGAIVAVVESVEDACAVLGIRV